MLKPLALASLSAVLLTAGMSPAGRSPAASPPTRATLAGLPGPGTGVIRGYVRDTSGAPLQSAQVFVTGTGLAGLTDAGGHWLIGGVPAGRVTVTARLVNYRTASVTVRVLGGDTTDVPDFRLVPHKYVPGPPERAIEVLVPRDSAVRGVRPEARAATDARRDLTVAPSVNAPSPLDAAGRRAAAEASVAARRATAKAGNAQAGALGMRGGRADWNTEEYRHQQDNRFLLAATTPLSTFSIDVDAASYSNVRRFLTDGQRPPADAVRIEELVNYFPYAYAEPDGDAPFSVTTDVARAPWNPQHRLVRIGLQAKRIPTAELPPSNLVFLIDVSGSMDMPNKLPLVKRAFHLLVEQLRPEDRVAIVVYAGNAGLVLPSTPGSDKERILAAIDRLEAGGSTAGGAGIQLAYDVARENHVRSGNNRVILATDGDFNVGVSSEGELVRLIERRREEGTYLTVLGFGTGNIKDSKMEQLADKGNGNYAYVDDILEARKVFVHELGATLLTVAKDVKIQVEFNPARVRAYRLVGYENRLLAAEDFEDDTKDAGELGAGHSVTALYDVVTTDAPPDSALGTVPPLRYGDERVTDRGDREPSAHRGELLTVKLRYKSPAGGASRLIERPVADRVSGMGEDFRFAAAVAEFGMVLRESPYRGSASLPAAAELARSAVGRDEGGYRAEFLRLVEAAQHLMVAEVGR